MFYVNKIVGWCLSPLGVMFLGVAAGCVLRRLGGRKLKVAGTVAIALALLQLWFFSCAFSTRWVGLPLEGPEADAMALPNADAIVLLGGGMGHHEECGRAEMFDAADRVWTAARLFKAGKAPLMTVSGGGAKGELALLRDMGVDVRKVKVLEAARNTEEEARHISALGTRRILLVTSAWHMPRAKMLFERAGFEVIAAPADYEMHFAVECRRQIGDFFPHCEALQRNSCAVKEWVARFFYWLKG